MGNTWTQFFPPKPQFTEQNLPDLSGKVYIVTGSNTGIGKELARMLYSANAKVYIAARSADKARAAISFIQASSPSSTGTLAFLKLDLADLTTIKGTVEEFLGKEGKLHVLFNNAGVMSVPNVPDKTAQGYEMNLGVNNIGTFLLTKLLTPTLVATAKVETPNTVRVVWVSSTIDLAGAKDVGVPLDNLDFHKKVSGMDRYGLSKTGNWLHATEYAKVHKDDGVVCVPVNPGNLNSELAREHTRFVQWLMGFIVHPVYLGGYSLLWAGLSGEVTIEKSGTFDLGAIADGGVAVWPWGRFGTVREDLVAATKSEADGGNGNAKKFWDWTEEQANVKAVFIVAAISAIADFTVLADTAANSSCTVTQYSDVPAAVSSCTAIALSNIEVPSGKTLDLSSLKTGTTVTFTGKTTFAYYDGNIDLIKVGGTNITITAAPDAVIDGNGQAWWDGLGSNGGISKPNHFITVSKANGASTIKDLYIQNWPVHCFSISNCNGLSIYNITLNNTAGDAPNNRSSGKAAAHNSDGFDISSCNNLTLRDSWVRNQDDCVAVTSGDNITVKNMYCNGSHGLSIGSVGGKSNNNVTNVLFQDSVVLNSQNGARIKTNAETTGYIANITYRNIKLQGITTYGIDIQQDYLNGGPTGEPTNGVVITNVTMENISGTVTAKAKDYYILCGDGSCSGFTFNNINITGGTNSSCNFHPEGNFQC
ncbi:hypothetical protein N0V90_000254 [Kalmusia sp. IMI 367209]|nr:hypothetical protein N0V90_000254 [Kalmusia sp. IMI 367209]